MSPYGIAWSAATALWIVAVPCCSSEPGGRLRALLLTLGTAAAVVVGARLHAQILESGYPLSSVWTQFPQILLRPGHRIAGGIALGAIATIISSRILRVDLLRYADVAAVAGCAAVGVGRVGCHLAGCCFGLPTSLPWGIRYAAGTTPFTHHLAAGSIDRAARSSLAIHPLAAYLSVAAFASTVVLLRFRRRHPPPGETALLSVALMGISVGLIELLRDVRFQAPVPYRQTAPLVAGFVAGGLLLLRRPRPATSVALTDAVRSVLYRETDRTPSPDRT